MDAGVDDQPHRPPGQAHQIAEPPGGIVPVHAQLVRQLFGIERPAFRIGVERQDGADQRQLLRIFALPDMAGYPFVIDEIGDGDAVVDRRIAQIDPDLARDAAVDGAGAAIGRRGAGLLRHRHPPDFQIAARQPSECVGQARADRVDPALHIGDDLPPPFVTFGKADAGAFLIRDGALGNAALGQPLAAQDRVHLRLKVGEPGLAHGVQIGRAAPGGGSGAKAPGIPFRPMRADIHAGCRDRHAALGLQLGQLALQRGHDRRADDLRGAVRPVAGDRRRLARERADQRAIRLRRLGDGAGHALDRLVEQEGRRHQPLFARLADPHRLPLQLPGHGGEAGEIGLGIGLVANRLIPVQHLRHVQPRADILDDGIGRVAPVADRRDTVWQRHAVQRGPESAFDHRKTGQRRGIEPGARHPCHLLQSVGQETLPRRDAGRRAILQPAAQIGMGARIHAQSGRTLGHEFKQLPRQPIEQGSHIAGRVGCPDGGGGGEGGDARQGFATGEEAGHAARMTGVAAQVKRGCGRLAVVT